MEKPLIKTKKEVKYKKISLYLQHTNGYLF